MKSVTRKVVCLMVVAVMVFALAACGNNGSSSSSDAIYIGGIGPITGPAAVYGTSVMNGAQIAVDEINAMDGEFKIEYLFYDDEHDAEKAVNAYNKLKDWGMDILLGTVTTTPCVAVSAETNADRYFELTPSASSADVTKGKDNVFQLCFTDPNQGTTAAKYIVDNKMGTKIAAIYNNADAYSTGVYNAFKAELAANGVDVVYEGTFLDDNNADFSVQLEGAKKADADLVFLPIYYTPASLIFAQADAMDYAPTFFGIDGMDGILSLEGFNTDLAEDVVLMTPFNPWSTDSAVSAFVKKYEEAYGETPTQFAADAYDCVYAIYDACVAAGVTTDMEYTEMCEKLVAQFTSADFSVDGLTGKGMVWSTNGEVAKDPVVCVIKDGIYVDR